jgi:hypothetical protein
LLLQADAPRYPPARPRIARPPRRPPPRERARALAADPASDRALAGKAALERKALDRRGPEEHDRAGRRARVLRRERAQPRPGARREREPLRARGLVEPAPQRPSARQVPVPGEQREQERREPRERDVIEHALHRRRADIGRRWARVKRGRARR